MASAPVFMFCAHWHVFGGAEGVGSHFHVLRSRTRFRRYRGRRVPFSCFALPDSFSAIPRASRLVFMLCTPEFIFGGTDGVRSCFLVLRSRARFWQCGGCRVPFSCFALSDSFSTVSESVESRFHVLPPVLIFGSTDGVGSRFNILRSRTHFL
jgi:hypothetical protein